MKKVGDTVFYPLNTKERLIKRILDDKKVIETRSHTDPIHSGAFYHAVLSLIDEFHQTIENTILPKELEENWVYEIGYNYEGIKLFLVHNDKREYYDEKSNREYDFSFTDQDFTLVIVKAKYLTAEEYAKSRNVGVGTVRQWIRRGKLRTAKKFGNEWRISEISDPPQRGYQSASYTLPNDLYGVPEELKYLKGKNNVTIFRDPNQIDQYYVSLWEDGKEEEKYEGEPLIISAAEREKLELFLIGNPDIIYVQNIFDSVNSDLYTFEEIEGMEV